MHVCVAGSGGQRRVWEAAIARGRTAWGTAKARFQASDSGVTLAPGLVSLMDASFACTTWAALTSHLNDPTVRAAARATRTSARTVRCLPGCASVRCRVRTAVPAHTSPLTPVRWVCACPCHPGTQVPFTLCHGDFHSSNMFLLPGAVEPAAVTVFDW